MADHSQLVERLINPPFADQIHTVDLHTQAANAIQSLQAENARLIEKQNELIIANAQCANVISEQLDEISRLRQALEDAQNGLR